MRISVGGVAFASQANRFDRLEKSLGLRFTGQVSLHPLIRARLSGDLRNLVREFLLGPATGFAKILDLRNCGDDCWVDKLMLALGVARFR